jgi:hypothetical protein
VDQVWHLHLLCSDAYWNDFCPRVLGRPLHHHPAKGGQAERDRFHEQYRATIRSYRQHFGEPPLDLWPPLDVRFGRDLQMQRGPIRRPLRLWRGCRSWRRWRWSAPMGGLLIGLGVIGSALASAAAGGPLRSTPRERRPAAELSGHAYSLHHQLDGELCFYLQIYTSVPAPAKQPFHHAPAG